MSGLSPRMIFPKSMDRISGSKFSFLLVKLALPKKASSLKPSAFLINSLTLFNPFSIAYIPGRKIAPSISTLFSNRSMIVPTEYLSPFWGKNVDTSSCVIFKSFNSLEVFLRTFIVYVYAFSVNPPANLNTSLNVSPLMDSKIIGLFTSPVISILFS